MTNQIDIDRIQLFALSATTADSPESSLGKMGKRNGLLLAVTDKDGATGWGEIWCNFPPRQAQMLAMLFEDVIAPHVIGKTFERWNDMRPHLQTTLSRMILHTAQPGPFAHCLAGLDIAAADLTARRMGLPLAHILRASHDIPAEVPVYASSPSGTSLETDLQRIFAAGHQSVKLKVGYDDVQDTRKLETFAAVANDRLGLRVDANQAWTVKEAKVAADRLSGWGPLFLEEPLRADAPDQDWADLAQHASIPIAAGENILSQIQDKLLGIVQPSPTKWGGVSGALAVACKAQDGDANYAFHYMGTALGLAAVAHICAAAGAAGPVELDANSNALRTELGEIDLSVRHGKMSLPPGPGHGFLPDQTALERFADAHADLRAT